MSYRNESRDHESYKSRNCEATLGGSVNDATEFKNQTVTVGHRFLV